MKPNEPTTVALIQMGCNRPRDENLQRAVQLLREASDRGAKIACLPELFCSDYFCQVEDHDNFEKAESIPGPTTDAISRVAKETKMVILASLFERRGTGTLSQHLRSARRRRHVAGPVSENAHPRRSTVL